MKYAHIVGWGHYLPERILTNDGMASIVDTSNEWIYTRTGIKERRIANQQETTAMMAFEAAARALAVANVHPMQVDMIIVATSTPAHMFPSTASQVQDYLGPAGPVRSTSARPAPALCMRSAWPPILSRRGRRKMWLLLGPKRCRVCWIGRIEAPVSFLATGPGPWS